MSDPRLPVEVDPWSDGRWSRVEREMFEKLDAPDGAVPMRARTPALGRRVLVVASLAAAAVALVFFLRPAGLLHPDDRLTVATTDSASSVTVGESSLVVAPRSFVVVSGDDDRGIDVVLDRGAVTCEVAPRKGRPPFVVDAGDVRVRVVGTRFTVARDALAVSVAVDHGTVEVTSSGKVATLHDGERWPDAEVPGTPVSPVPMANASAAAADGPPAHATAGTAPLSPGRPHPASVQESAPARPSPHDVGAAPDETPAVVSARTEPAQSPSPQDEYEAAARVEKLRPDEAEATYRRLAAGATAWAPSALFALARLEADRGDHEDAQRRLHDYLARYPRGINADDARALLQRLQ
jgi:hypothetical protein